MGTRVGATVGRGGGIHLSRVPRRRQPTPRHAHLGAWLPVARHRVHHLRPKISLSFGARRRVAVRARGGASEASGRRARRLDGSEVRVAIEAAQREEPRRARLVRQLLRERARARQALGLRPSLQLRRAERRGRRTRVKHTDPAAPRGLGRQRLALHGRRVLSPRLLLPPRPTRGRRPAVASPAQKAPTPAHRPLLALAPLPLRAPRWVCTVVRAFEESRHRLRQGGAVSIVFKSILINLSQQRRRWGGERRLVGPQREG